MKKLSFLIIALFISASVSAQIVITYDMLRCSRDEAKALKNLEPTAYTARDGHTYHIGDRVLLGYPAGQHTTSVNNGSYAIHTSTQSNYQTIVSDASIAAAVLGGVITYMADRHGEYLTINSINIILPRKNSTVGATVNIKGQIKGVGGVTVRDFDTALDLCEIQTEGMTREMAIQRLREAKEHLDLEIITREEYDALKAELTPYIK